MTYRDQMKLIISMDTDTNVYGCLLTANKVGGGVCVCEGKVVVYVLHEFLLVQTADTCWRSV